MYTHTHTHILTHSQLIHKPNKLLTSPRGLIHNRSASLTYRSRSGSNSMTPSPIPDLYPSGMGMESTLPHSITFTELKEAIERFVLVLCCTTHSLHIYTVAHTHTLTGWYQNGTACCRRWMILNKGQKLRRERECWPLTRRIRYLES